MRRVSVTALALSVFGLVLLAFLLRAFGQFLLGPRRATLLAGPVAVLAGLVLALVIGIVVLDRAGVVSIDEPPD